MERFAGRSKDTLIIPSKPISEGYKIWAIGQMGYLLHWVWHKKGSKKGQGPQGVVVPKALGANKTAAMVSHLLLKLPETAMTYCVYLDNLFTSTKLLSHLRTNGIGATGTCRPNSGIYKDFVRQKKKDAKQDQIPWGTLQMVPSEDNLINHMAWKDNALCLFQSTIHDGETKITRNRKRPSETSASAKTARKPFGDQPRKNLDIPDFDDDYNYNMGAVDRADQLRSYMGGLRRIRKGGWHAIWHFLFFTVLVNCWKLSFHSEVDKKFKFLSQREFRIALQQDLFKEGRKQPRKRNFAQYKPLSAAKDTLPQDHQKGSRGKKQDCKSCQELGRTRSTKSRGVLGDITTKNVLNSRPKSTRWGCLQCDVPLCQEGPCFEYFHSNIQ